MKISTLKVAGFRGFTNNVEIDLSANVVVLYGPNGTGKTSILDAILWSITGKIPRFKSANLPISKYARDGMARVEIHIQSEEGLLTITRSIDTERNEKLRLQIGEISYSGSSAKVEISRLLLGSLNVAERPSKLIELMTRGVYLQQDLIREFIDADKPEERFELLSEMAGVGSILDFQTKLEGNRRAWRKNITRVKTEELEPVIIKHQDLTTKIDRLNSTNSVADQAGRSQVESFLNASQKYISNYQISSSKPEVDEVLRLLSKKRNERSRYRDVLLTVKSYALEIDGDPDIQQKRIEFLSNTIFDKTAKVSRFSAEVEKKLGEMSELQKLQLSKKIESEQLSVLAKIAMEHLDGACPVCNQEHDVATTRERLSGYLSIEVPFSDQIKSLENEINRLRDSRDSVQFELNEANESLSEAKARHDLIQKRLAILDERLKEVGLGPTETEMGRIDKHIEVESKTLELLSNLLSHGEKLNLQSLRSSELKQYEELKLELDQCNNLRRSIEEEVKQLEKTDSVTSKIIEGLRESALDVTRNKIQEISPLFQRIYSRIDPHPTFKVTQLVADKARGKGRMSVGVTDPNIDEDMLEASPVLSSSQLNSFAVSLFLSLNLSLPSFSLDVTILDDPLQNLDTINLLGLVDVLRRFKKHKQIFISTHDPRLKGLLERKLRPVNKSEKIIVLEFENWTTEGPTFEHVSRHFNESPAIVLTGTD